MKLAGYLHLAIILVVLVSNMSLAAKSVKTKHVKYVVNTFAGGNHGGDGFNASAINLEAPRSVVVNSQGDLVFTDNTRIKQVSNIDKLVKVIAGTEDTVYFNGLDGQLATSTKLATPHTIRISPNNDIYFSDVNTHSIRLLNSTTGKISTIAGTYGNAGFSDGTAESSLFSSPSGIAFGVNSEIFVSDPGNNRIRKIALGMVTTIAGNGNQGYSGDAGLATDANLNNPIGLVVNLTSGDVYFCDSNNHAIRKIESSTGNIYTIAGNGNQGNTGDGGLATDATLSNPSGIVISPDGKSLYFTTGNFIRKINETGYISSICGNGDAAFSGDGDLAINAQLNGPTGLFIDSNENLYVVDAGNARIRKISALTGIIETLVGSSVYYNGDGLLSTQAILQSAIEVVSFEGITYIADKCRIRKVDKDQKITTIAGTDSCEDAVFKKIINPGEKIQSIYGLAVSPITKELFVVFDVTIYKVTSSGTLIRVAGGDSKFGGDGYNAKYAVFNELGGFTFLTSGEIVIADTENSRIRKISNSGIVSTIAGNGLEGYSGENVRAVDSSIGKPFNVIASKIGEIYFASSNYRVHKISLDGNITTIAGNGGDGLSGIDGPATDATIGICKGLALSSNEELLYIASYDGNAILVVNFTSGIINTFASVTSPQDIALSYDGLDLLVLVGGSILNRISIATQQVELIAGTGSNTSSLNEATGVSVASNGDIYISENLRLRKISNGIITTIAGTGNLDEVESGVRANSTSVFPKYAKIGPNGDLYLVDRFYIRKISNEIIETVSGGLGDGGLASEAALCPNRIYINPSGDIYFTDSCFAHNVRKISYDTGIISTIAGGILSGYNGDEIPAIKAKLNVPFGITINPNGDIFVVELNNLRIRRISKDGIIHTLVGNGISSNTGDGGPAELATIGSPYSVIASQNGDIIFSNYNAGVIRKISALDGNITAIIGIYDNLNYDTRNNVLGNETTFNVGQAVCFDDQNALIFADDPGVNERKTIVKRAVPFCEDSNYHLSGNNLTCVPTCFGKYENASCGGSLKGSCVDVDLCECESNWFGLECGNPICFNKNGTDACNGHGACISAQTCQCNQNWTGIECDIPICFGFSGKNACSGKGNCTLPGKCECESNWFGLECGNPICFNKNGTDACNGRGVCISAQTCQCNQNWTGIECDIPVCFGFSGNSACNGNGNCSLPGNCDCKPDWTGTKCETPICFGLSGSNACGGKGSCILPGQCQCNQDWTGIECDIPVCFGLSGSNACGGKGNCTLPGKCECIPNYMGETCNITTCYGLKSNDSSVCSSHGKCADTDMCICDSNWVGSSCNTPLCFGLSNSTISCSGHGLCVDVDTCKCDKDWYGTKCTLIQCFGKLSNDSLNVCSGHGICNMTDTCNCSMGYFGTNCEKTITLSNSLKSTSITPQTSARINSSPSVQHYSFPMLTIIIVVFTLIISLVINK